MKNCRLDKIIVHKSAEYAVEFLRDAVQLY